MVKNYFFNLSPANICSINNLTATSGTFQSPGYPGNYDNNLQCDVIISVTPGKTVQITFDVFDVEPDSSCQFDYIQVNRLLIVTIKTTFLV